MLNKIKSKIEENRLYCSIKNMIKLGRPNANIKFSDGSKIPVLINSVINKRAYLNDIILEIGIYASELNNKDVVEDLYKTFSYEELKGTKEEVWEEQLTTEINEYDSKRANLLEKLDFLKREVAKY